MVTAATLPRFELSPKASALFPTGTPYEDLLASARSHPAVFLDLFGYAFNPAKRVNFKWRLWDWQWEYLARILFSKRTVVLKARQLGVSWLCAGYALWVALFHPNSNIILLSRKEQVAADLLAKCAYIYRRLPPELKPELDPRHDKDNDTELFWRSINSRIRAIASTKSSGRSDTTSLVIADEWADHPFASDMYSSYEPTVGDSGQIIGVSTAKGRQGLFYQTYMGSKRRQNTFDAIFLSASLHPDYTDDFLRSKKADYDSKNELWKYFQEYPTNDIEAFGGSVQTFLPAKALELIAARIRPPVSIPSDPLWDENLRIWIPPHTGRRYTIGADPNNRGSDNAVGWVMDSYSGEHCATLRSPNWSPYKFAELLNVLGRMYSAHPNLPESVAMLVPEINNSGTAVLEALQHVWQYPNLYRTRPDKRRNRSGFTGWRTDSLTRPLMLTHLYEAVGDGSFQTNDGEWLEEAYVLTRNKRTGRVEAEGDGHDDFMFASGIAWYTREQSPDVRGVRHTTPLSR